MNLCSDCVPYGTPVVGFLPVCRNCVSEFSSKTNNNSHDIPNNRSETDSNPKNDEVLIGHSKNKN